MHHTAVKIQNDDDTERTCSTQGGNRKRVVQNCGRARCKAGRNNSTEMDIRTESEPALVLTAQPNGMSGYTRHGDAEPSRLFTGYSRRSRVRGAILSSTNRYVCGKRRCSRSGRITLGGDAVSTHPIDGSR
jgi:hypothetical protein